MIDTKNNKKSRDAYHENKKNPTWLKLERARLTIAIRRWRRKNKQKNLAQRKVFIALRNGTLIKEKCKKCGKKRVHAHHKDYSKPLKIIWLCPYHHSERHRYLRSKSY